MSVRAYRINKIDTKENNTFNLWHDNKLKDFFDTEYGLFESMTEGCGITELPVKALKRALKEVKGLEKYIKEEIEDDIKWAEKKGEDYIQYYCF